MNIAEFLQSLLGAQAQPQNRLAGNWRGADSEPNRLIQPVQAVQQMAQQAAPMPQAAPPAAIAQPQAPQPDQVQTASVAPPMANGGSIGGGGIGGFLGNLFGGERAAENQTIQWLQQQGMDPGTATMMAKSKPILQAYLLKRSQGVDPKDALQAEKLGLEIDQMKHPQRRTTTIDGKLVDQDTGELIKDYSKPAPQVRDLTAEEVKQRGYPAGSYQVDEKGNVSTVGGAREQDPTFGREKDIRQEYENSPIVKGYQIVRDNYERMRKGVQLGTGAGDAAIVFGYMKMLDPTSVVREGEQASAMNAAGVPEAVRGKYNQLIGGGTLSAEARQQILGAGEQVYGEASKNLGDLNTRYSGIAANWQLDPARIVQTPEAYDPLIVNDPAATASGLPLPPAPAAPVAPAAPGGPAPNRFAPDIPTDQNGRVVAKPGASTADGWREVAPGVKLRRVN